MRFKQYIGSKNTNSGLLEFSNGYKVKDVFYNDKNDYYVLNIVDSSNDIYVKGYDKSLDIKFVFNRYSLFYYEFVVLLDNKVFYETKVIEELLFLEIKKQLDYLKIADFYIVGGR